MDAQPTTDLALMMAFMRDLVNGQGEREPWTARIQDLKARGYLRQTHSGRALPTEAGLALWAHAKRAIAREVLGLADPQARKPFFCVLDAEGRPVGFTEWECAVAFARWQMESRPAAFHSVSMPEDAVELWDRSSISPEAALRLDESGHVQVDPASPASSVEGEAA